MKKEELCKWLYVHEPATGILLRKRPNTVYDFVRKGNFDIYVNRHGHGRRSGGRLLIKPELTRGGNSFLPSIYDIIGWAAYLPERGIEEELTRADALIDYIFSEEYQNFPWGYGYMTDGSG